MNWRDHAEDDDKCWCKETYPVIVNGLHVGTAKAIDTGDYQIFFDNSPDGKLGEELIASGVPVMIGPAE